MSAEGEIDRFLAKIVRSTCPPKYAGPTIDYKQGWHEGSLIERVWARIDYHGLASFLYTQSLLNTTWPPPLVQRIADEARNISLWEATHQSCLASILENLNASQIKVLVMKGSALAYSLYPSPEIRRRGDSDLLVYPQDLSAVREILIRLGWSRFDDPHGLNFQESWVFESAREFRHIIDLHWQASDRPIMRSILDLDLLFAEAQPLPKLSDNAHCAALETTMVQCIVNQHWHFINGYRVGRVRPKGVHRLIWLYDLDCIVRTMTALNWDRLFAISDRHGIGPFLADALQRTHEVLGTPLAPRHLAKLAEHPLDPDFATYLSAADKFDEVWLDFLKAHSWQERIKLLGSRAFPPISHLHQKYPTVSHWPMLLRARFIMGTLKRVLRKAIRR